MRRIIPVILLFALFTCSYAKAQSRHEVPKIDFHVHYHTGSDSLLSLLEDFNMRANLVSVASNMATFEENERKIKALVAAHPDRFFWTTSFDPFAFNDPDFAKKVIAKLAADIDAGARLVKVWKNIGMELKDTSGAYVQIDNPRFQPIWDYLAQRGIPVLAHIAEPLAAWRPLDPKSPHNWYYSHNPQYHAYQHPEIPRWETIVAARDRWVERNPKLVIVGAHLGSMEFDVDEIARRLDKYPNFYVETSARMNDLAMQPSEKVRRFLIQYQDRVMYGTDVDDGEVSGGGQEMNLDQHLRYLSGSDMVLFGRKSGWNVETRGLGLPREVLEKVYYRNAERVAKL